MTDDEKTTFEQYEQDCRYFNCDLQKPHGLRKYFYLAHGWRRLRLGKDWEVAKRAIPNAMAELFRLECEVRKKGSSAETVGEC